MIYDVFVSYQHEDFEFVRKLVSQLESLNLKCWYAPRNISGRYAKAIVDGISHSRVFLLILNHRSATSVEVLNEVEIAHNIMKKGKFAFIQPLCMEEMDFDNPDYSEIMYHIRRIQFCNCSYKMDVKEIAKSVILSQPSLQLKPSRTESKRILDQEKEIERLVIQNSLFDKFDEEKYKSLLSKYNNPTVLDVGCGNGSMIISRLDFLSDYTLVGIDDNKYLIEMATEKYKGENCSFVTIQ